MDRVLMPARIPHAHQDYLQNFAPKGLCAKFITQGGHAHQHYFLPQRWAPYPSYHGLQPSPAALWKASAAWLVPSVQEQSCRAPICVWSAPMLNSILPFSKARARCCAGTPVSESYLWQGVRMGTVPITTWPPIPGPLPLLLAPTSGRAALGSWWD